MAGLPSGLGRACQPGLWLPELGEGFVHQAVNSRAPNGPDEPPESSILVHDVRSGPASTLL
jgi:hypothetical protein